MYTVSSSVIETYLCKQRVS